MSDDYTEVIDLTPELAHSGVRCALLFFVHRGIFLERIRRAVAPGTAGGDAAVE